MASILVDSNVLIRLRDESDVRHDECRQVLAPELARHHGLSLCAQSIIEYWVVVTRPTEQNGLGLSPEEAAGDLQVLRGFLAMLPEPPDVADRWFEIVSAHNVRGKPSHDARLVAVMRAHHVRKLLTLNPSDFARFSDVECVAPADLLRQST